ncbi:MAG: phosphatase domain-containing protein [Planctomycetota bacterium]
MGLLVIVGGGIWLWEEVEDRFIPKRWGAVIEGGLYRSGQLHPALIERTFVDNGIDLVVSLIDVETGSDEDRAFDAVERQTCQNLGIERRVLPLQGDGTGNIDNYALAIAAIDAGLAGGQTMLVHCAAGSQRTGGVVACYRVLVEGWTTAQARAEMERFDWDPKDDRALTDHLNANMAALTRRLVELGVIDAVPDPLPQF